MLLLYLEKETTIFTFFHVDFCLREINPNSNKLFKWGVFYHARFECFNYTKERSISCAPNKKYFLARPFLLLQIEQRILQTVYDPSGGTSTAPKLIK